MCSLFKILLIRYVWAEMYVYMKQCQVEGQDYSAKSRIWALQNFTGTIEI